MQDNIILKMKNGQNYEIPLKDLKVLDESDLSFKKPKFGIYYLISNEKYKMQKNKSVETVKQYDADNKADVEQLKILISKSAVVEPSYALGEENQDCDNPNTMEDELLNIDS